MSSRRSDDPGRVDLLLAPAKTLELLARLRVEPVADATSGPPLFPLSMAAGSEVGEEEPGREGANFLAGHPPDRVVRRDDADELVARCCGGEPLEQVVRMRRVADRERTDLTLLPRAVEDRDPARAPLRDEARENVDESPGPRSSPHGAGCSRRRGTGSGRPSSRQTAMPCVLLSDKLNEDDVSRRVTLASRLVQEQSSCDADVQRADTAGERDRDDRVAGAAHERAHALAFGAQHKGDAAREVGTPHRERAFGVRRIRPEARALDLREVAREIRHDRNGKVLDRAGEARQTAGVTRTEP